MAATPVTGDGEAVNPDRYWPLGDGHIRSVEEAIGWALPEDYKTFVGHYGLCQPTTTLAV